MFLNLSQLSVELVFTDDFGIEFETLQNLQNKGNKTVLSLFNFSLDQISSHDFGYFRYCLISTSQVVAHIHLKSHITDKDDCNLRWDYYQKWSQKVSKRNQVILVTVQQSKVVLRR